MPTPSIGIVSTGSYLPKDEVTNGEIAKRAGVTEEWISRKTQIGGRRFAAPAEATSDLATRAAEDALRRAGLSADAIDYLILSTSTGDSPQPPTSYLVQGALGAMGAACFDINVVCSGFVYATELARSLITLHPGSRALVVAADLYSRILDFEDYRTSVLLGDGAAAAVVAEVPDGYGFIDTELVSRGDAHALIRVEGGGSRRPVSHEGVDAGEHFFRMDGRGVRDFVMDNVPGVIAGLTERSGLRLDQIDHFVPHQPNGVLLTQLVELAGLSGARTHRTLERYGNVGNASLPIALDDANQAGRIGDGDVVLMAAFGGGMSIGATLLRWGSAA
jgi:3-oxoacyl-[acyl-carrier-protein] synthase-3